MSSASPEAAARRTASLIARLTLQNAGSCFSVAVTTSERRHGPGTDGEAMMFHQLALRSCTTANNGACPKSKSLRHHAPSLATAQAEA